MITIDATLVAELGYPRFLEFRCRACGDDSDVGWLLEDGAIVDPLCIKCGGDQLDVVLEPQGAFGLALRLDAWERVCGSSASETYGSWAVEFAVFAGIVWCLPSVLQAMIARITHIGLDHRIRRALGEEPKAGTLGRWAIGDYGGLGPNYWNLQTDQGLFHDFTPGRSTSSKWTSVPALAGITDTAEALVIIADKVAP